MAGAIKGCTGREPTLVGKPSPLMIDYIVDKYGCERSRICMVGDRLDTDILFGQNNGLLSCLTLSGVTTEAKLLSEANEIKPDYYVDSIAQVEPPSKCTLHTIHTCTIHPCLHSATPCHLLPLPRIDGCLSVQVRRSLEL